MQRGEGLQGDIGGFPLIFPKKIWHYPNFMNGETTEIKERCLKFLIANGDGKGLEAAAHLVVIQALESSNGTCSGSLQKSEYWIALLKRNNKVSWKENLVLTVEFYNLAICAWARSYETVAIVMSEWWLNELRKSKAPRNAKGDELENRIIISPNTDSYNFFLMGV